MERLETFDFGFELSPWIRIVFFMGMAYLVSAILFYFGTHEVVITNIVISQGCFFRDKYHWQQCRV